MARRGLYATFFLVVLCALPLLSIDVGLPSLPAVSAYTLKRDMQASADLLECIAPGFEDDSFRARIIAARVAPDQA